MSLPENDGPEGLTDFDYARYADLKDAVVLITGGASGIGAYLTCAFAGQGAKTAILSLPDDPAEALCDAVEAAGAPRPFSAPCDLRDLDAAKAAIESARAALGDFSVLVNNAARDDRHDLASLTPEAWDDSLNTNLRPFFFTAQAVAGGMKDGGSIINMGSNSALLGLAGYPAYVTAKAGIGGLTKALARELGPQGVRVNTLIPGWVMTRRQKALWVTEDSLRDCLDEQCLKRAVAGEDIASAALFLASQSAAMISGQSLVVDGGRALS